MSSTTNRPRLFSHNSSQNHRDNADDQHPEKRRPETIHIKTHTFNNEPYEWGQGAAGYGKRVANITGQYGIQRTVTFGIASLMHEDNRYFGSGKAGFWPRTGYAVSSSVLARHDNGKRYPSISLIASYAASAFVSRSWQPPSTHSAGDGATSFGYSMGYNVLACAVKEFRPDLLRPLAKWSKTPTSRQTNTGP